MHAGPTKLPNFEGTAVAVFAAAEIRMENTVGNCDGASEGSHSPRGSGGVDRRRTYRGMAASLRCGVRDASSDFSFLRLRGLRGLLKALRSVAASESGIRLFRQSQSVRELQVIPVLFESIFRRTKEVDLVHTAEPMKLKSPAADSEIALALRVLEGCCLLCKGCAAMAYRYEAVKVVMSILCKGGMIEQKACLDALVALLVNSPANVLDFKDCRGMNKVVEMTKDARRDTIVRTKCAEFLLLFFENAGEMGEEEPSLETDDAVKVLGEKCTSLILSADGFSSMTSPEAYQTELSVRAERILESLEPL